MNDGVDVLFVDTHAEGDCADEDSDLVLEELLLDVFSLFLVDLGVVFFGFKSSVLEIFCDSIGHVSIGCIDQD